MNRAPTTRYPKSLAWTGYSPRDGEVTALLKPANSNKKLGKGKNVWTKGQFKGLPLYSLTLQERATCDNGCPVWNVCYGDHMPFAFRFDVSEDEGASLMAVLSSELEELNVKHPKGFSIRLHVLGDFFSVEYVRFWGAQLERYPTLKIFGYTHRQGDIRLEIDATFQQFAGRFNILQSDSISTIRPSALVEGFHPLANTLPTCPEQSGKSDSCLTCGLCTNPTIKGVKFLKH